MKIKKILFFLLFLIISFCCFSNENNLKINDNLKKNSFTFYSNNEKSFSDNIQLIKSTTTGSKASLYKTGVNLLIFGLVSGGIGGIFAGAGFILTWSLSVLMHWSFQETLSSLIISYVLFGESSYYASLAISCFVLGAVFGALFFLFIPGVILMAIGSSRSKNNIGVIKNGIGMYFKI